MNSANPRLIGIFAAALILAIYLGSSAATAQAEAMIIAGIIVVLVLVFSLGRNIWILIPTVSLASLSFRFIPGNLSFFQLSLILFVGFTPTLLATRRIRLSWEVNAIHFFSFLVLICVLQGYLRNPVGLAITGSANVGARPYFDFALAFMAFVFLSGLTVEKEKVLIASRAHLWGTFIAAVIQLLSLVPGLALPLAYVFGTTYSTETAERTSYYASETAGRNFGAIAMATALSRFIVVKVSPLRALFKFSWAPLLALSLALAALGGFRSKLAAVVMFLALAVFYYDGMRGVVVSGFITIFAVLSIAIVNLMFPLPAAVQRSLSFLPGTWEKIHVEDAENSTDWRTEIWIEALTTDRWIRNKVLGDGLGFTKEELSRQIALREGFDVGTGGSGFDAQRESILINGDYHSGPVSLIRTTGYVGLVVFFFALCVTAFRAHKLIRRYRYTEFFGPLCILCIPMVMHPIFFAFVVGDFKQDVPQFLVQSGLLILITRSLAQRDSDDASDQIP